MVVIIQTGGKQYLVKVGDILKVERVATDPGSVHVFDKVIGVLDDSGSKVGSAVSSASVEALVLEHRKASKVLIFKKKRRHNYRRKLGHRQPISVIKIQSVTL